VIALKFANLKVTRQAKQCGPAWPLESPALADFVGLVAERMRFGSRLLLLRRFVGRHVGRALHPRLFPVVEFGLVGAMMHVVDEHVAIADIEALKEIYAAILDDYFCKE
jgi:acetylornithine deacetylase/succinyl-diaminopimelate desuccinylase-like protein